MAGSVNKVILIGNLGKDPEIRRTQDGRPIANFSVATSESWRDKKTGERKEKTEWHRVVIFNEGLCRIAEQYLEEGLEGLSRRRAADAQMARQGRPRQIFHRSGAAELQLAAHHARPGRGRGGSDFGSSEAGDFGSSGPTRGKSSRPWPAPASVATWTTKFRFDSRPSARQQRPT